MTPPSPSLARPILALAIPVALSAQIDTLVGVADIFIVSPLGADAISAVGMARIIAMVVGVVMVSATTGAFAMVAQQIGAGLPVEASATAKQAFTLSLGITTFLSAAGYAGSSWLMEALSLAPGVVDLGGGYLRVFFVGLPVMMLNFALSNCLYGAGDTRTPLYINAVVSVVKVALTWVLVTGALGAPALGVPGAALGTVLGGVLGLALGFALLYSGRLRLRLLPGTSYWIEADRARRILRIGIPAALQGLFRNGSNLVFAKLVALTPLGTQAVAAFAIGNQVERFLRRTSLAFGTAATTLVGNSLGAGQPDEAGRRGEAANVVGGVALVLCGLPLFLAARPFMEVFTDASAVIEVGVAYLWAVALAEPFMCLGITAGGGLRGAGDTKPALYYTIISQWIVRIPVGWLLAFRLGLDEDGLWIALVLLSVVQGLLTWRKFRTGEWKERQL